MMVFRLMISRRWWWTTLLVMGGTALTIRLGIWQIDRFQRNQASAYHLLAMKSSPTIEFHGDMPTADLLNMEYRQAQATGTFDFAHQIAIRNQVWPQTWGYDVGFKLVTPLILPDGSAVLVDRGWIPMADKDPANWIQYNQGGCITVMGIIRLPAKPYIGGATDPTLAPGQTFLSFWNVIDIPRIQEQIPYSILPVYIQQAPDPGFTSMPYRALSDPEPAGADVNVAYAITWFSFALLLIAGYPLYLRKQTTKDG
jgi:surfeit locus 1 family protein